MSGSRLIFSTVEWESKRERGRDGVWERERDREKYHRRTQKPLGMPYTPPIVQSRGEDGRGGEEG